MKEKLKNRYIRGLRKDFADNILAKFDRDFLERLIDGVSFEVVVMFADISGFTEKSKELGPEKTMGYLNEILPKLAEIIYVHNGITDKYIGDGILAYFGGEFGFDKEKHINALKSSLRMLDICNGLGLKIGLASGEVYFGIIGREEEEMVYGELTGIGDAVNLASRLQDVAKRNSIIFPLTEEFNLSVKACEKYMGFNAYFRRYEEIKSFGRVEVGVIQKNGFEGILA